MSSVPGFHGVELPDGVAEWNEVLIWTGNELLFWGGADSSGGVPVGEPGYAYDLDANVWRTISLSPKPATFGATGVWTGDEAVICCGARMRATAAYDPAVDSWRSLPDAPISGEYAASAWTGDEMLLVTGDGVASLDPEADAWRSFPEPPRNLGPLNQVAWTGEELVVWPAKIERRVHRGMALDPKNGTWRLLPEPPAWPAALDIAWTGDHLVIWGGLPAESTSFERAVGARLDVGANIWAELPEPLPEPDACECNLGSQTLLWAGDRLVVSTGHFGTGVDPSIPLLLEYHPGPDSWILVGASPAGWGARTIMAGDRVVFRSDRLYVSEPGWAPDGIAIPPEGLPPTAISTGD